MDKAEVPVFWKGGIDDIASTIALVKKGTVHNLCTTPGGHTVTMVEYGEKSDLKRTANYSSAMGAGDYSCYADRTGEDYVPAVLLIGAEHGGEFEGTVAVNNLICEIETGVDYAGNSHPELMEALKGLHLLLIPCANMDGRARLPLKTFVGLSYDEFRYYSQGTWKDGTLCEHPGCKRIHPIKDACDFLGGYFNDDGVNIVHDNFFFPMAKETAALLKVADEYAPDFTIHLHGGGNCKQTFYNFDYLTGNARREISALSDMLKDASEAAGLGEHYNRRPVEGYEDNEIPPSFNIMSAFCAINGMPNTVYETNQGLHFEEGRWNWDNSYGFEEIYQHHRILFKTLFDYVKNKY